MKLKQNLFHLLLAQLVLIVALFFAFQPDPTSNKKQPLVPVEQKNITKLVIDDGEQSINLVKKGSSWYLPNFHNLPVNSAKLTQFLQKLTGTEVTWPVTTTSQSHDRFEVSDDNFQRKISFYENENEQASLLLGTSPSFKKVHSRLSSSDDIYAIDFNNYEASTDNNSWLDKSLLAVKEVASLSTDSLTLEKNNGQWQFSQSEHGEVDQDKVSEIINTLRLLSILDVASNDISLLDEQAKTQSITFSVSSIIGKTVNFSLFEIDDNYYVKTDEHAAIFTLAKKDFDTLTQLNLDTVKKIEQAADTEKTEEAEATQNSQ
ncbi:DUF4340 domain-containing protein [Thalassotalea agariperforans]